MSKLNKRHDPLSRKFLSDPQIAREFVLAYMTPELLGETCGPDGFTHLGNG